MLISRTVRPNKYLIFTSKRNLGGRASDLDVTSRCLTRAAIWDQDGELILVDIPAMGFREGPKWKRRRIHGGPRASTITGMEYVRSPFQLKTPDKSSCRAALPTFCAGPTGKWWAAWFSKSYVGDLFVGEIYCLICDAASWRTGQTD